MRIKKVAKILRGRMKCYQCTDQMILSQDGLIVKVIIGRGTLFGCQKPMWLQIKVNINTFPKMNS